MDGQVKNKIRQYVIYTIVSKKDGKLYVGASRSFKCRMQNHFYALKNLKLQSVVHRAMNKHGVDNFNINVIAQYEIDENKLSKTEIKTEFKKLLKLEQFFIKHLNSMVPNGYNLTEGGEGTMGYEPTQEERNASRERGKIMFIGENNPFY